MRSSPSGPDPLDPGPRGFAHRGLHVGSAAPENSLAAFERAVEFGAGIECDVRLSGDGSAVVFHDPDLIRMCGVSLVVEQTPAALLERQRLLGSNQYIPALSRALEVVGARVPLLLELKTHRRNAARLCREVLLKLSPRSGPVGIMSFDPKVGGWLRKNAPYIPRGLVMGKDLPRHRRLLAVMMAAPHVVAVERESLGAPWVASIRRRMPVYAWTIRTAADRVQASVQADALIWEGDGGPRN